MDETTIVLPSARAIRHEQLQIDTSSLFLPNFITMNEFISKLCIVDGFKAIDDDSRTLLLLEASDFKGFSSLQIERNFFTFTKNSTYIFKFFEELSAELYDIKELESSDIYAEYEEHITILNELYLRYEELCLEKKVLDKIFLPKLYTFNEEYAQKHNKIKVKHIIARSFAPLLMTVFQAQSIRQSARYGFMLHGISEIYIPKNFRLSINNGSKLTASESLLGFFIAIP